MLSRTPVCGVSVSSSWETLSSVSRAMALRRMLGMLEISAPSWGKPAEAAVSWEKTTRRSCPKCNRLGETAVREDSASSKLSPAAESTRYFWSPL